MTVPHCGMQLLNLTPGLTRLELLLTTTSEWEILPSFTKLRSLACGCSREGPQLHSSLSKLTKLQLAFGDDVESDLSCLTQLKVLIERNTTCWVPDQDPYSC